MPFAKDGKITHLVHYPDQVVIYYEGGVAIWSKSSFDQHPVAVGQCYQSDDHLMDTSTYDALLEKAYRWLAIRDYPYMEMQHKLSDAIDDTAMVEHVLQTLVERHLINDTTYAQHQFEKVIEMGYGSLHLRAVLIDKGIPLPIVEEVVTRYDDTTERQLAESLVREWLHISTLRQKAPASFAASLLNRLKTRGFKDDILLDMQESILQAARQQSVYDVAAQLEVYQRLQFSAYKMSAKLRALGYDEDVIVQMVEEVRHD